MSKINDLLKGSIPEDLLRQVKALSRGDVTQTKPLLDAIAELQLKLDEQIAYSKKIEKDAMDCCEFEMATELCDRLNQSPAQSLKQLKADVMREFASKYSEQSIMIHSGRSVSGFAEECANQLLKEGE